MFQRSESPDEGMGDEEVDDEVEGDEDESSNIQVACPSLPGLFVSFLLYHVVAIYFIYFICTGCSSKVFPYKKNPFLYLNFLEAKAYNWLCQLIV